MPRHRLLVVPGQAGGAACAVGGVQLAAEASAKTRRVAEKWPFPQNTTVLTGQQSRLLRGSLQSQVLGAGEAGSDVRAW